MRLFTAVVPPADVLEAVVAVHHVVGIERWERQPHITLRYFGEVSDDDVSGLSEALHEVEFGPFALTPTNIATFGNDTPDVVWIGFEQSPALEALHHKISVASARFIGTSDRLSFVPHMTIARTTGAGPTAVQELIDVAAENLPCAFEVRSFVLLESTSSGYEARGEFSSQVR